MHIAAVLHPETRITVHRMTVTVRHRAAAILAAAAVPVRHTVAVAEVPVRRAEVEAVAVEAEDNTCLMILI